MTERLYFRGEPLHSNTGLFTSYSSSVWDVLSSLVSYLIALEDTKIIKDERHEYFSSIKKINAGSVSDEIKKHGYVPKEEGEFLLAFDLIDPTYMALLEERLSMYFGMEEIDAK